MRVTASIASPPSHTAHDLSVAAHAPNAPLASPCRFDGLCRSLKVSRYPTQLLLTEEGFIYEYHGPRAASPLLAFAQGGYRSQGRPNMQAPMQLLPNAGPWQVFGQMLWETGPLFRKALLWSFGIAFGLKGGALLLLRCLRRGAKRAPAAARAKSQNAKSPAAAAAAAAAEDSDGGCATGEHRSEASGGTAAPHVDGAGEGAELKKQQ